MGGMCCAGPAPGEEARIADNKSNDKNDENSKQGPMTKRANVDSVKGNIQMVPEDQSRQ